MSASVSDTPQRLCEPCFEEFKKQFRGDGFEIVKREECECGCHALGGCRER